MSEETNCSIDHGYPNQEKIARKCISDAGIPTGAIHNGREFFRRLTEHYDFQDSGGHKIDNCYEFEQLRLCFETLATRASQPREVEDTPVNSTITIPRATLQGVREALVMNEAMYDMFFDVPEGVVSAEELANSGNAAMDLNKQALASLDAVLSEGE